MKFIFFKKSYAHEAKECLDWRIDIHHKKYNY